MKTLLLSLMIFSTAQAAYNFNCWVTNDKSTKVKKVSKWYGSQYLTISTNPWVSTKCPYSIHVNSLDKGLNFSDVNEGYLFLAAELSPQGVKPTMTSARLCQYTAQRNPEDIADLKSEPSVTCKSFFTYERSSTEPVWSPGYCGVNFCGKDW